VNERRGIATPWIILALAAAAFLLYANTLPNGLTLDDQAIIVENQFIRQVNPLGRYFSTGWWAGQGGYGDFLYRPLTLFSYGLQYGLHGTAPFGYHLVNLLLYTLCIVPVYRLLRRFTGRRSGAFWGTLIFALHAVHSEAVANVVGRAELLAFLCGVTVLWLHARAYHLPGFGRPLGFPVALPVALALFFCGAAAKESALLWLPVLLLWDLAGGRPGEGSLRKVRGNIVRTYLWYLLPAAGYLLLRLSAMAAAASPGTVYYPVNPLAWADTMVRLLTGIKLLFYQQLLLLFPFRLCSDYSFAAIQPVAHWYDPLFLLALAGNAAMAGTALLAWRRSRQLFFAITFFYTTALIGSNIPLAIGTIFGERLLFTPSFALALAAGWLLRRRGQEVDRRRVHALALTAIWLAASAVTAMGRGPQWQDNRTLFLHDLEVQPRSVVLNLRAAAIHRDEGDMAEAERLLLRSLEILPDDPVALNNLGELLRLSGRFSEANSRLRQALAAAAGPCWAPVPRNRALPCYNLGLLHLDRQQPVEAVHWLRKAALLDPSDREIRDSLLQAALSGGSDSGFLALQRQAEADFPGHPTWLYYQGLFELYRRQNPVTAEQHLAAALAADPRELRFHIALADLLAQTGRWTESAALYRVVLERFYLKPAQAAEINSRLLILEQRAAEGSR